jgi:hypothetical protein
LVGRAAAIALAAAHDIAGRAADDRAAADVRRVGVRTADLLPLRSDRTLCAAPTAVPAAALIALVAADLPVAALLSLVAADVAAAALIVLATDLTAA